MTTSPRWPLGDLLRQARRRQRLSIRQAATRAGFSEGLWRQLESGVRYAAAGMTIPINPKDDTLLAAADAVGLPREDVFAAVERALPDDGPVPEMKRHQIGMDALSAAGWNDVSPEDQASLLRQVAALAEQERQRNAH